MSAALFPSQSQRRESNFKVVPRSFPFQKVTRGHYSSHFLRALCLSPSDESLRPVVDPKEGKKGRTEPNRHEKKAKVGSADSRINYALKSAARAKTRTSNKPLLLAVKLKSIRLRVPMKTKPIFKSSITPFMKSGKAGRGSEHRPLCLAYTRAPAL